MPAAERTMWQQLWQQTLQEFKLENQGRPVENLWTVTQSPIVFWSKLMERNLPQCQLT